MSTPEPLSDDDRSEHVDSRALLRRLVDAGLPAPMAGSLLLTFPRRRVADVLNAVDLLGDDWVRDRRGWIVDALGSNRDLTDVLSARWEVERRWEEWDQQRADRERIEQDYRDARDRSTRWGIAVSDALDDDQLVTAIERVTAIVPGLDRRPVPVVRAQLLAWAVAVERAHPERPLHAALTTDLETGPTTPDGLHDGLPEPPAVDRSDDDLSARIEAVLARRPDLAFTPHHPHDEPPAPAPTHVLEHSLTW